MRNPINMLSSLQNHSSDRSYTFERLYRNLYNRELFLLAYQNIYASQGNMTKGTDGKTIDAMSLNRIDGIIASLKDESYQPQPSRRTYIPKKNGKLRPLGIPSFDDKLVQECVRLLLEAVYEGSFAKTSHGFRPNHSCHTALSQVQACFTGVKWFVEGDIKGFFDNINHEVMIGILAEHIKDERFLRLIRKFLKAGYLEDWQYHNTYSGTPQGGIISPILANIYLDKLDRYMEELKKRFDKGAVRAVYPETYELEKKRGVLAKKLRNTNSEEEKQVLTEKIREIDRKKLTIPYSDPFDTSFKRLQYVRYADDFLIGVIGSKEDAIAIKEQVKAFVADTLILELSDEKTLITHSEKRARFLGYDIYVRRSAATKKDKTGRLCRHLNGTVCLEMPTELMRKKLLEYSAMTIEKTVYGKDNWKAKARYYLKDNDDLEILDQYNSEIRGFRNYYRIANNAAHASSFGYIMQYSMFKTFATKYRTTMRRMIGKLRIGKNFGVRFTDKKGKTKTRLFYNEGFARKPLQKNAVVDVIPQTVMYSSKTSLMARLSAGQCELCGKTDCEIEIHHVRKLKDLKGKSYWERFMIARNRKTLALCLDCHEKLHSGKLN
ncbi:Group II intron-encoded protein LtrA [Desulfitobacterium hafniense]|uniref:RNA-directed DNA polymerase n=1 Tax=Desulfitobacterium hafniense TaxID=49338 RepID=A0A098AVB7_DESHA|nr:reverse transcriptase domain-containing protein [Desulfitobacterium hafniense]CDX00017.1 Group II intron-encoded protein LtrA [Desulfitobacterium hafniense]